ncbi:MAG: hypothetical protein EHM48_02440 [Planctomycetaceae bacterium]|nr:MAG: hypothetical protein EHM48_02440 [Planctomycetaceae bacterium]
MKRIAMILAVVSMVAGVSMAAEGKGRKGHGKEAPSVRGQITAVDVQAKTVTSGQDAAAVTIKVDDNTKVIVGREPAANGIAALKAGMFCGAWVQGDEPATMLIARNGPGKGGPGAGGAGRGKGDAGPGGEGRGKGAPGAGGAGHGKGAAGPGKHAAAE